MIRRTVLIAMLALAQPALAQETAPAAEPAAEDADRLVVTGRPLGMSLYEFVDAFVAEIGDPTSESFGYAAWEGGVCVSVVNIPEEAGQFLVNRVSEAALEVGLRSGGPGCRPNILVVFTGDGAREA